MVIDWEFAALYRNMKDKLEKRASIVRAQWLEEICGLTTLLLRR